MSQVEGAVAGRVPETERHPERQGAGGSPGGDARQGVESENRHIRDPLGGRSLRSAVSCSGDDL